MNIKSRDFLFTTNSGKPHSNFTDIVMSVFKYDNKRLTPNLLRHAFISHYLNDDHSVNDMKIMASFLGHNLQTMMKYRKLK